MQTLEVRMNAPLYPDPNLHIRTLYVSLLDQQERFDEFKYLLSLYPRLPEDADTEPPEAAEVRERLTERVREWTGMPSARVNAMQIRLWRDMLVDKRVNLAVSPWKEANHY
jgi:hypothetical protein